jgi:hypothetical protein
MPEFDNWDKELHPIYSCETCMHYRNFRCRKHAPRGLEGWPAVFPTDFCGDHKMDKDTMKALLTQRMKKK